MFQSSTFAEGEPPMPVFADSLNRRETLAALLPALNGWVLVTVTDRALTGLGGASVVATSAPTKVIRMILKTPFNAGGLLPPLDSLSLDGP